MAVQTGDRVNFVKLATPADFPSAQDIDDATLYFITSTKEVYLGSILISTGPSVTQTNSDSVNALHELLLSGSADNITRDEGARKTSHLRGNPSDGTLNISGQLTDAYGVQSSRILTQAQYNALPQAEQENGTDYYISDADPTVNQALWNKVGTDPLDTVAQNLSGAINELAPLKDDVSTISTDIGDISADIGDETLPDTTKTVKGNINAINAKVGSDTLTTTAQNLSGAINEHETDISTINSNLAQKVNIAVLSTQLEINYADSNTIGYRTTETTKVDITSLQGYPTGKTYIGSSAKAVDIYGATVYVDSDKYLRGVRKISGTVQVSIYVFYKD